MLGGKTIKGWGLVDGQGLQGCGVGIAIQVHVANVCQWPTIVIHRGKHPYSVTQQRAVNTGQQ